MEELLKKHIIPVRALGGCLFLALVFVMAMVMVLAPGIQSEARAVSVCFESREGYSEVTPREIRDGWPSIKCSDITGGVLWWGDPFDGTDPMGEMPGDVEADYLTEAAVVKPRIDKLMFYPCSGCHGTMVRTPRNNNPREITSPMYPHEAYAPRNPKDLKHGQGAIWCLDCHDAKKRDSLVSHRGELISFNQPQKLCGKCHGQVYRDWREGIHGKRIGMWPSGGKKRWWVCTECHNPHDVQPGFKAIAPEPAPALPKGMTDSKHERTHYKGWFHPKADHDGDGDGHGGATATHDTPPGTTSEHGAALTEAAPIVVAEPAPKPEPKKPVKKPVKKKKVVKKKSVKKKPEPKPEPVKVAPASTPVESAPSPAPAPTPEDEGGASDEGTPSQTESPSTEAPAETPPAQ